jgi:hypothetical protein
MMAPPMTWSVRARGGDRLPKSRLSPSPGVGRGGDRLPRSRWSLCLGVGRGGDRLPESRLSPSPGVGRGGDRLPRSRWSPSLGVGLGGDRCPRSRLSPSPRETDIKYIFFKKNIVQDFSLLILMSKKIIIFVNGYECICSSLLRTKRN